MKKPLLFGTLAATASCLLPFVVAAPSHAQAQPPVSGTNPPPAATAAPAPAEQTVTLDVRDAPVRQVLTQLFDKVKVDYSLDNSVSGFVTLKVTDQPFETVLRLILRSASAPLTYTRTSGIYEVKPRLLVTVPPTAPTVSAEPDPAFSVSSGGPHFAVINLTYLDPFDVQALLGITIIPSGSRGGGSGTGSPAGGSPFGGSGLAIGNGGVGTLGGNGTGGRIIGSGTNGTPGGRGGRG